MPACTGRRICWKGAVLPAQSSQEERCPCLRTDPSDLKVGMLVAVSRIPYGTGGRANGHVGLYVGDGRVRDCAGGRVRTVPLELWLSAYGVMADLRWGWLGSITLDEPTGYGPAARTYSISPFEAITSRYHVNDFLRLRASVPLLLSSWST